jgi:hypothetical protein
MKPYWSTYYTDDHPSVDGPDISFHSTYILIIIYMVIAPWIHHAITWTTTTAVKTLLPAAATDYITNLITLVGTTTMGRLCSEHFNNFVTQCSCEHGVCTVCAVRTIICSCLRFIHGRVMSCWLAWKCPSHLTNATSFAYRLRLCDLVDAAQLQRLTIKSIRMNIAYGPYSVWRNVPSCVQATVLTRKCNITDLNGQLNRTPAYAVQSQDHTFDFGPGATTAILSVIHHPSALGALDLSLGHAGITISVTVLVYGLEEGTIFGHLRLSHDLHLLETTFSRTTLYDQSFEVRSQALGYYTPTSTGYQTPETDATSEEGEDLAPPDNGEMASDQEATSA